MKRKTTINRILQGLNSHRNTLSINSNHIYVLHSSSSMKSNTIFFNALMKHVPNNNNKINHPATTSFGQIRSYTTTNWLKEKEASTNDSDVTNTSAPSSSEPITLNLMDYKKWNAQQVASVLTSPKSLGGAGLSVDDVKPLYEAGFDSSSLHNIAENIMMDGVKYAIDQLQSTYNKISVPQLSDTCQTVVFWVLDQLMTRQYSLWQLEPIATGGADLSLDQASSLDDKSLYTIAKTVISANDEAAMKKAQDMGIDLTTCTHLVDWIHNKLKKDNLQVPLLKIEQHSTRPNFRYFSPDERERLTKADEILRGAIDVKAKTTNMPEQHKRWYLSFCNLVLKGQNQHNRMPKEKENYAKDLQILTIQARDIVFNNVNTDNILSISNFETVMNDMMNEQLANKNNLEKNLFMRDILVPLKTHCKSSSKFVKDVLIPTRNNEIAKDLLPFLPKLQVDLFDENERKKLDQKIREGSTIHVIGPSGVGKTALITRRLGVNPGIMITCSSLNDSSRLPERSFDKASLGLRKFIEQSESIIHLYATASQLVQCNLIARLISLHTSLHIWEQTDDKTPFENPLQMLSYSQWNGNTLTSSEIFTKLISINWLSLPAERLRDFTIFLIKRLYVKLKLTEDQSFIIAIDEANIFSYLQTSLLSFNGTPRDLLSLIEFEISLLREKCNMKISDMYCGTFFTTDIADIIQSSIGKTRDIAHVYSCIGLDEINFDQALQLLGTMYDVDAILTAAKISKTKLGHSIGHIFPTRRRIIGLVSEKTLPSFNLIRVITDIWNEFVGQIEQTVLERFDNKTESDFIDAFLLQVMLIHEYSSFLGKTITCNRQLASSIIGSGLAKPNFDFYDVDNNDLYYFDASDPILRTVAKKILENKYPNLKTTAHNPMTVLQQLLFVPQNKPYTWNLVFSLLLQHHSGKFIKDNEIISTFITNRSPYISLRYLYFVIKSFISSVDFYLKHHNSKWAQVVLKKHSTRDKKTFGDVLYFHCVSNYDKHINKKSNIRFQDIIDGLYFFPAKISRLDGICLNFSDQPYGIVVSNKLHNCNSIIFEEGIKKGIKAVNTRYFYKQDDGSTWRIGCSWYSEHEAFLTTLANNNKLIPLLAHIHINYKHLATTNPGITTIESTYSNNGKFLIMNPDSSSLRKLCPDLFNLVQQNLFNTATFENPNL
ncbi:hypothetical protein C9374_009967 [Naegleria lovaniensis]|uniref:Uncharacterized protein n=1 Tax=Naegleria lovaniensis TaxID=51637 RepID=A0AA88GIR8_NAELO|nr:uncharacterized protein C9374_009967 [Naegleria lovaniensis]KAG2375344.1 hypothetical protein C9374_009967 [Naegleria lovaniensis]